MRTFERYTIVKRCEETVRGYYYYSTRFIKNIMFSHSLSHLLSTQPFSQLKLSCLQTRDLHSQNQRAWWSADVACFGLESFSPQIFVWVSSWVDKRMHNKGSILEEFHLHNRREVDFLTSPWLFRLTWSKASCFMHSQSKDPDVRPNYFVVYKNLTLFRNFDKISSFNNFLQQLPLCGLRVSLVSLVWSSLNAVRLLDRPE